MLRFGLRNCLPQCGHFIAESLTSCPHSGHLMIAMWFSCTWWKESIFILCTNLVSCRLTGELLANDGSFFVIRTMVSCPYFLFFSWGIKWGIEVSSTPLSLYFRLCSHSHGDATTLSRLVRLFCCLPPLSLVFTGFPLIASLRMIVQNGELFGFFGHMCG